MQAFRERPVAAVAGVRVLAANDYQARTRREGSREVPLALPRSTVSTDHWASVAGAARKTTAAANQAHALRSGGVSGTAASAR